MKPAGGKTGNKRLELQRAFEIFCWKEKGNSQPQSK